MNSFEFETELDLNNEIDFQELGFVTKTGDGVAFVSGLPECMVGELVEI
jgi:F0F1-type ATP synthase alpha subunit